MTPAARCSNGKAQTGSTKRTATSSIASQPSSRSARWLCAVVSSCLLTGTGTAVAQDEADANVDENWFVRTWNRIPHEERDLPWLLGDANVWSGVASAVVLAGAMRASDNSARAIGLYDPNVPPTDLEDYGDAIFKAIPGAAYAATVFAQDWQGLILMGAHNAISSGVMSTLKKEVGQRRPNNQDSSSFPSGHTNTAFIGAAFLQQRYGPRWGVPAYISAGLVGWSRMHGNKHYLNDVFSGASISMISAWALVPPYESDRRARWRDLERFRPWRYEWEMTLNEVNKNTVQAPSGTGDPFTVPLNPDGSDDPWANSHIGVEYRFDERRSVYTRMTPWEIRTLGEFSTPTNFAGLTFPANEQLRFSHRMWQIGGQFRYGVIRNKRVDFTAGAGLTLLDFDQEVFVVDDTQPNQIGQIAAVDAAKLLGTVTASLDVALFWKLWLGGSVEYSSEGSTRYTDWSAKLMLRFNSKWDTSIGWREFDVTLRETEVNNDFRRSGPALNIVYSF